MEPEALASSTSSHPNYRFKESASLQAILASTNLSVPEFFDSVWQDACAIFPYAASSSDNVDDNDDNDSNNPFHALIQNGEAALIDLLEQARRSSEAADCSPAPTASDGSTSPPPPPLDNIDTSNSSMCLPLLFKNQTLVPPDDRRALYGSSLFAAFLNGCSVVVNHSDWLSPLVAALCQDLQHSFPHVYANSYITPANSQAVHAHADDRDVLVVQVVGAKAWRVYQRIPIPYPYPHEQVGKDGLQVPDVVLTGPCLMETILQPGDCLYMPRGFVHEARATVSAPSFHVTLAFATHDWSLAGLLAAAGQHVWTSVPSSVEYRKAIPREFGMREFQDIDAAAQKKLQQQIDQAMEALRREVTVETVQRSMAAKYRRHNERARIIREELLMTNNKPKATTAGMPTGNDYPPPVVVVGRLAAERVTMSSRVRAATEAEKASLDSSLKNTTQPRGLLVQEANYQGIIHILQHLKSDPTCQCCVRDLRRLWPPELLPSCQAICDWTLLSFARQCVELGALAVEA